MRFDRMSRPEEFQWTARKQAAFLNRHERIARKIERKYPLFVEEFAPVPETDVDAEQARRARMLLEGDQRMRDLAASQWRRTRAEYFACAPDVRARIMAEWRTWPGAAKPVNFAYVVEKHNGVGEAKRRRMRAELAAMDARITARLAAQRSLLEP